MGCVGSNLIGIGINLILYEDDIILVVRSTYDLCKYLRILQHFYSKMDMPISNGKVEDMIIKSIKITYDTFIHENNILKEFPSYKYLGIGIHHKLNWNYSIRKCKKGGWKHYYGFQK